MKILKDHQWLKPNGLQGLTETSSLSEWLPQIVSTASGTKMWNNVRWLCIWPLYAQRRLLTHCRQLKCMMQQASQPPSGPKWDTYQPVNGCVSPSDCFPLILNRQALWHMESCSSRLNLQLVVAYRSASAVLAWQTICTSSVHKCSTRTWDRFTD